MIYLYKMHQNIIRIIGLVLDIIGTCIIAFSVITLQAHLTQFNNINDLERELEVEFVVQRDRTVLGLVFILVGFLLIMFAEFWDLGIIQPIPPQEVFGL
jgi:hypothetical protein